MEDIHFSIVSQADLRGTSIIIGSLLGMEFTKDESGDLEEVPAYIATIANVRFFLLGNPDPEDDLRDEPTDDFELVIESDADINHDKVIQYVSSKLSKDSRIIFSIID